MGILLSMKLKNNLFNPSFLSIIIAIFALLFAFYYQYFLGYKPCYLCMLQRYGYAGIILISLVGIFYYNNKIIPMLLGILFIIIISISFWHLGIELQWWAASLECSGMTENIGSLTEELKNINKNEPIAKCDQMSPKLFNITLVQWSFIYGLVSLIILTILIVKFNKREE